MVWQCLCSNKLQGNYAVHKEGIRLQNHGCIDFLMRQLTTAAPKLKWFLLGFVYFICHGNMCNRESGFVFLCPLFLAAIIFLTSDCCFGPLDAFFETADGHGALLTNCGWVGVEIGTLGLSMRLPSFLTRSWSPAGSLRIPTIMLNLKRPRKHFIEDSISKNCTNIPESSLRWQIRKG